jgi:hypothetical protein
LACIAQWGCLARAQRFHMNIMDGLIPFLQVKASSLSHACRDM